MEETLGPESTDPTGSDVEGDNELGTDEVSPVFLRCGFCRVSCHQLLREAYWLPIPESQDDVYGFEDDDSEGFGCWLICDGCAVLVDRALNIMRSPLGRALVERSGLPGNGDVRDQPARVGQPADLVEEGSDSDGCGLAGGHSRWEVGGADSLSGYSETPPGGC